MTRKCKDTILGGQKIQWPTEKTTKRQTMVHYTANERLNTTSPTQNLKTGSKPLVKYTKSFPRNEHINYIKHISYTTGLNYLPHIQINLKNIDIKVNPI